MAIFHIELRQIKRQTAKGKIKKVSSIVAYRERIKIDNFDYSKKKDFIESFCLFPKEFENSEYAKNLKNAVFFSDEIEKIERRKDSQLFDEIIVALPKELTIENNKEIIKDLITEHYISANNQMARICIHNTKNNIHAHILIPQRPLENSENGVKFGKKIRQEFSKFGKPKSSDKLIKMRSDWADLVNSKLAEIGSDSHPISHLSIKNRRAEALAIGDLEMAAKYDRPAFYLPATAYNPKFRLITRENDRFTPDLEKMSEARKFYAKRHDLENYRWSDLLNEREFWDELEDQGRIKIGVGLSAIRKMFNRLIKIITNKQLTDSKNDRRRNENGDRDATSIFVSNYTDFPTIPEPISRAKRYIDFAISCTNERGGENTPQTIYSTNHNNGTSGGDAEIDHEIAQGIEFFNYKPTFADRPRANNGRIERKNTPAYIFERKIYRPSPKRR